MIQGIYLAARSILLLIREARVVAQDLPDAVRTLLHVSVWGLVRAHWRDANVQCSSELNTSAPISFWPWSAVCGNREIAWLERWGATAALGGSGKLLVLPYAWNIRSLQFSMLDQSATSLHQPLPSPTASAQ